MKYLSTALFVAATLFAAPAIAKSNNGFWVNGSTQYLDAAAYKEIGLDLSDIQYHKNVTAHLLQSMAPSLNLTATENPLSSYETYLPHSTQADVSPFERAVLAAYLDQPHDLHLAKFLAVYHHVQTVGQGRFRTPEQKAQRIKHHIYAQYFLNRVKEIGGQNNWVEKNLANHQAALDQFFSQGSPLDVSEDHEAHNFFIESFNYLEGNRYQALDKLMVDLLANPNNALTNTYLTTVNLWLAAEADFDDSTMLYSNILGAFFSVRSIVIAEQRELAWKANPAIPRFRLASGLGGWTIPPRRWLAQLVQDHNAVAAIDNEHREWRPKNRTFHSLTLGIAFYNEKENFQEGMAAFFDGFTHCREVNYAMRSCGDHALLSFNILGYQLGAVDFLLKTGQLTRARQFLLAKHAPHLQFNNFTLGKAAWQHREQNLAAISALYQNEDVKTHPTNFLAKRQKWGADQITCQTCHQAQGRSWTDEEKSRRPAAHESIATVGTWPAVSTTWYGSSR